MTRVDASVARRLGAKVSRASEAEESLAQQLAGQLRLPQREFAFHPTRRWRFDFAWPHAKVAVEVEGGVYPSRQPDGSLQAGHARPAMFTKDVEKYNEAAILGWMLIRVTPKMVKDGTALTVIERALHAAASHHGLPTRPYAHEDD